MSKSSVCESSDRHVRFALHTSDESTDDTTGARNGPRQATATSGGFPVRLQHVDGTCDQRCHREDEQRTAAGTPAEVGRGVPQPVGQSRDQGSDLRSDGGPRRGDSQWPHAAPSRHHDDRDEQSSSEENRADDLCRGQARPDDLPQHDGAPDPERSHPQDLRPIPGNGDGSSGLRSTFVADLRGTASGLAGLLQVGSHHVGREREGVRLPVAEAGKLASEPDNQGARLPDDEDQGSPGVKDITTSSELRIERRPDREDQAAHGGDGDDEGAGGGSYTGAETQENGGDEIRGRDSLARELQHGLRQRQGTRTQVVSEPVVESGARKMLPESAARHLEHQAWALVPSLMQELIGAERPVLMEVACSSNSILTRTVQQQTGKECTALRCAEWNQCDLKTPEGISLVLEQIEQLRPQHVWIAPPGSAFSPMQNLNQKNPQQQAELQEKRRLSMKMYKGCVKVMFFCVQSGIHATWEWPERCQAWRLPVIQSMLRDLGLHVATTKGCRVNLRESEQGRFLQKGWKLATTHARLAEVMHMPCHCPCNYKHARCESRLMQASGDYTPEFAKRVTSVLLQELKHEDVVRECQGQSSLLEGFGEGPRCTCEPQRSGEEESKCAVCLLQEGNVTLKPLNPEALKLQEPWTRDCAVAGEGQGKRPRFN